MAAVSPLLKPLGVAAAGIASFEGLVWGVLSLLGLLACQEVYNVDMTSESTRELIIYNYLYKEKGITLPFMSLYLVFSVIWLIVSSVLLAEFLRNKFKYAMLVSWTTVTFATSILDLVTTIIFGLEFGKKQDNIYFDVAIAPLLILLLSARGFVLWLANVAAAVYLSVAAHKLRTGVYSDNKGEARRPSSDAASFYEGSMTGDRDYYSRANLAYQPEPLSAWNIQSPTVGDMKRGPWNFDDTSSPVKIPPVGDMRRGLWNFDDTSSPVKIPPVRDNQRGSWNINGSTSPATIFPRAAKPVPAPIAPNPLPTPQPDYSPPLGRPVRHEPNMYEAPLRSALKKPAPFGRTIL